MANAQIKITQLPNIDLNDLGSNTILPVVNTTGTAITEKVTVGNVANFILNEAGNLLPIAGVAEIAYSVANAAQPNITSVGNLTGLTVTNLNNFHLPGGTNGYVLQTNGNGNLNWTAQGGEGNGNPGGANSQIQFNNSGLFAGSTSLTWDAANTQLNTVNLSASGATIYGNLATVNATVTTNLTAANANFTSTVSNTISATGNITANFFLGNGSALTGITATANGAGPNNSIQYNANGIFAGDADLTWDPSTNILTANNITATANISANKASVTGNVSANIVTANFLYGDGSNISNIVANTANYANLANFVTVESVNNNFSYHVVLTTGPGDSSLHSDEDDNFQYNPVDGTMTVTRVDAQFVQAGNVISNLIPFSNITYNLGSNTHRWKDIWLANSTIHLGDSTLSANGNSVIVSGLSITDGNIGNIGNIASINLDGNSGNILYGNGVFAAAPSGGGLPIANGNSNINIANANGNVTITSAGQTWTVGTDGALTAPNGSNIYPVSNNFNIFANTAGAVQFYSDGGNFSWSLDGYGVMNLPFASALSNTSVLYSAGNFRIDAGANNFVFTDDGNLSLPSGGSLYSLSSTPSGAPGNTIVLQPAGPSFITDQKLMVYPTAGDGDHIHMTTGNLYQTELFLGNDNFFVKLSNTGNVVINPNDNISYSATWTFSPDGNLVLANGNSVIYSIPNSSLDPLNPNVSTMVLTPDQGYSSQALVLDPTAPGHIHLRAPGANIDEPYANLFLGGEDSSFEIGAFYGVAPNVFVHSGGNTWTFATDGNLIFPRDANINTDPYLLITGGPAPAINSVDASLTGPANFQISSDYLNLTGFTGAKVAIKADNGEIATDANMVLTTNGANIGNTFSWTLAYDGSLTLPGNLVAVNASPAPVISGFSSVSALQFTNGNSNVTINANSNIWTFDSTGNLKLPGNTFAVNYANGTQASAPLVDVLNTNGLTTVFYPTFVEDRTDGQIVRADVDLSYRTDTNTLTVGNVVANNFSGNISITGNVTGTSPNVQLVAGSYTYTFDNAGVMTLPAPASGNEGGEIQFTQAGNSTLSGNTVTVDSYVDQIRFFEGGGTARGAYIDLSQAAAGVGTLLNNRVSAYVNAGVFVTMDNLNATVTTSGGRGLSLATQSGSFNAYIGANFNSIGAGNGGSAGLLLINITPSNSIFGWNFINQGDTITYIVNDITNLRCYRITLQIGSSFNNNMISIERLI